MAQASRRLLVTCFIQINLGSPRMQLLTGPKTLLFLNQLNACSFNSMKFRPLIDLLSYLRIIFFNLKNCVSRALPLIIPGDRCQNLYCLQEVTVAIHWGSIFRGTQHPVSLNGWITAQGPGPAKVCEYAYISSTKTFRIWLSPKHQPN